MKIKDYYLNYFKPSPLGIKVIIVLYGFAIITDLIDLICDFGWGGIVGLFLSVILFLGFLLRWEIVRVLSRFFIALFSVGIAYSIITSEKFRMTAIDNAIWWAISWAPAIIVFFYLGTHKVKILFRKNEEIEPQAVNPN